MRVKWGGWSIGVYMRVKYLYSQVGEQADTEHLLPK